MLVERLTQVSSWCSTKCMLIVIALLVAHLLYFVRFFLRTSPEEQFIGRPRIVAPASSGFMRLFEYVAISQATEQIHVVRSIGHDSFKPFSAQGIVSGCYNASAQVRPYFYSGGISGCSGFAPIFVVRWLCAEHVDPQ